MEACATDEAEHTAQTAAVQKYNDGSWNSTSFTDASVYAKYYSALRKLAIFIENVDDAVFVEPNTFTRSPEINVKYQNRFKAECYFLRAFYYFELVKRFGGVPIVPQTRLTLDDEINIPRNSYDECVKYIIDNCDSAANLLPVKDTDTEWIGHATKAAALALKSRMQLYAASELNNPSNDLEKWKQSAATSRAVLDMTEYGLVTSSSIVSTQMFNLWNDNFNKEVLFGIKYFNDNSLELRNFPVGFTNGQGLTNPTQDLVDAFEMADGTPISKSPNYDPQNPYVNRDPRLEWFITCNGTKYGTRVIQTYVGGIDGLNKDQSSTKTGYYLKKFMNLSANLVEGTKTARHQWIHFRYAEILLNYAEAMNEAYGPTNKPDGFTLSALDAVNLLRTRVSMPALPAFPTQNDFRQMVRNERRVELCFEGHRFWDVRRWKIGEVFNQPIHGMKITLDSNNKPVYEVFEVEARKFNAEKMYLMPIPQSEMVKSDALKQNTNW
jgi:starch-binding outer membrane protein, SusD/RagB family